MVKEKKSETNIKLELLAKRNNVSIEEVMTKFAEHRKVGIDETTAYYATVNDYRKVKQYQKFTNNKTKREITTVYGFIIGSRGIWDKAQSVRNVANSFIKKVGIQAAKEQGFIDEENHILDKREKIYGRVNLDYDKPLPENLHVLDLLLYGYFRHNSDKKYKFGTIQTSDNALARGWDRDIIQKNRYYTPCQVNAIIDSEEKDNITLRATTAKDTPSVFKALSENLDIKTIIDKSTEFLSISKCELRYEEIKMPNGKTPWDHHIAVKGVVTYINDRPDGLGRITIGLMNPDNEEETIRLRIDTTVTSIDFGELSELYVFGKLERSKYKDKETNKLADGDVVIDIFGIYVVTKTPKTTVGPESTNDEDVIEGWLSS